MIYGTGVGFEPSRPWRFHPQNPLFFEHVGEESKGEHTLEQKIINCPHCGKIIPKPENQNERRLLAQGVAVREAAKTELDTTALARFSATFVMSAATDFSELKEDCGSVVA